MAVKSFTQQCPSCEANVPIKDRGLVGKKIDCPKCKYRFVVEDPAVGDDEKDAPDPKASKNGKKPAPAKAGGAAAAAKAASKTSPKKPAGKSKPADDDEDEKKPRPKKQSGSNTTMLLGIGLGAVALVLLGIAGIFLVPMMLGDGTSVSSGSSPGFNPTPATPGSSNGEGGNTGEQPGTTPNVETANLPDPTNYLPNDSLAVSSVNVKRLLESSAGVAMFRTAGAFNRDGFHQTTGIPLEDVSRVVTASNPTSKWVFSVIRTSKPFAKAELLKNLNTRPGTGGPILGYEWFLTDANYDPTSRFFIAGDLANELALHVLDTHTFILASPTALRPFLEAKTKPKQLTEVVADPAAGTGTTSPMGMGMETGSAGASTGMAPPMGPPPGMGPPGMTGPGGMQPPVTSTDVAESSSYMTIPQPLKRVLDRVEAGKSPVIFSTATDMKLAPDPKVLQKQFSLLGTVGDLKQVEEQTQKFAAFGVALVNFTPNRLTGVVVAECENADDARALNLLGAVGLPLVAEGLGKELDIKVKVPTRQNNTQGGSESGTDIDGGVSPPGMGSYAPPPGMGSFTPPPGMGGSYAPPGTYPPGMGEAGMGGMTGQTSNKIDKTDSTLALTTKDKLLVLNVDLVLKPAARDKLMTGVRQMAIRARGAYEMARGQNRIHDLAAALSAAAKAKNHFPRGTAAREPSPDHGNLPWRPDQRVSWMAELLPFLRGEFQGLRGQIDPAGKSWQEDSNLLAAGTLVPAFLSVDSPPTTWWVNYPRVPAPVAATHFVGVSGVGLDAADYTSGDAANAKRMGVFGYERVTQFTDITDGSRNTIAILQMPPTIKSPWLAGGGATVRGVPEKDSIRPFVCAKHKDKLGTFAIFCDGTVRFIPATISDADFKALCTIAGGEEVDLRKLTEEIPGGNTELKTQPLPIPAGPKKGEPKKEEPKKDAPEAKPKSAEPLVAPGKKEPRKGETKKEDKPNP